jgi:hypothetical protein
MRKKEKNKMDNIYVSGEIVLMTNMLGDIFNKANKLVCSNCQMAKYETSKEADKNLTIYSKECGCCSNCVERVGYFYDTDNYEGLEQQRIQIDNLKKDYNFDKDYGFFDNIKKECKLPREKRSRICLRYFCSYLGEKLKQSDINLIYKFTESIGVIRRQNKSIY